MGTQLSGGQVAARNKGRAVNMGNADRHAASVMALILHMLERGVSSWADIAMELNLLRMSTRYGARWRYNSVRKVVERAGYTATLGRGPAAVYISKPGSFNQPNARRIAAPSGGVEPQPIAEHGL